MVNVPCMVVFLLLASMLVLGLSQFNVVSCEKDLNADSHPASSNSTNCHMAYAITYGRRSCLLPTEAISIQWEGDGSFH